MLEEGSDYEAATRVLIIDEDPGFTKRILTALCTASEVQIVTTGADILYQVHDWQPDIIVLDLLLHDIDGFGLLERLVQLDVPSAPFILCVGDGRGALLRLSSDAGWPVGTIPRSASLGDLRKTIHRATRHRGSIARISGEIGSNRVFPV